MTRTGGFHRPNLHFHFLRLGIHGLKHAADHFTHFRNLFMIPIPRALPAFLPGLPAEAHPYTEQPP